MASNTEIAEIQAAVVHLKGALNDLVDKVQAVGEDTLSIPPLVAVGFAQAARDMADLTSSTSHEAIDILAKTTHTLIELIPGAASVPATLNPATSAPATP